MEREGVAGQILKTWGLATGWGASSRWNRIEQIRIGIMTMRGRKPELRAIEGGLSRLPPAPSWLPTEGKAEWRRVVPGLRDRKVVTKQDLGILESYCLAVGTVRRMQTTIAAEGDMVTNDKGDTKRHPAFQTMFQALTESRRLAAELGLTPASRNKAAATEGNDDDLADLDL